VLEDVSFLAPDVARQTGNVAVAAELTQDKANEASGPLPYQERMTASGP
jgi:hypothetical protein